MKSASKVAERWKKGMSAAGDAFREGVAAVTEAPTAKAAARADAYVEGVNRAVAERRFQEGLLAVSNDEWKRSMIEKALPRLTSGATAGESKMAAFLADFLPYEEEGKRMLERYPRGDLEQNLIRAAEMARWNAKYKRKRR